MNQVPGSQVASSHLSSDELEIGMGIHNEPGNMRLSPVPPLHSLLDQLISLITSTSDPERGFLPFQNDGTDEIVLLVNNLGGISELELGGIVNGAVTAFNKINIKIRRILAGTFMVCIQVPVTCINLNHICGLPLIDQFEYARFLTNRIASSTSL